MDDDDVLYVAYGNTQIYVAQLSDDATSQVKNQMVFNGSFYIEGSRFYKRDGSYYIFNTQPANAEGVLKGSTPWGSYTQKLLEKNIGNPLPQAGVPHQGGIVSTQKGDWYYMSFIDGYPAGRSPVLAPIKWDSDGWPVLQTVGNNTWAKTYPYPDIPGAPFPVPPHTGTDHFTTPALGPEWEW